jgi:hypothetical protein
MQIILVLYSKKNTSNKPEGCWLDSRWGFGFFHWANPSSRTVALGLTQPLTEMSSRNLPAVKRGRRVTLTTSPPCVSRFSRNVRAPMPNNYIRLHGLLQEYIYIFNEIRNIIIPFGYFTTLYQLPVLWITYSAIPEADFFENEVRRCILVAVVAIARRQGGKALKPSQYNKFRVGNQPGYTSKWSTFVWGCRGRLKVSTIDVERFCWDCTCRTEMAASIIVSLSPGGRTLAVPCGCSDQWSQEHCPQAVIMRLPIQRKQSFDVPIRATACPLITRHCVRDNERLFSHISARCMSCCTREVSGSSLHRGPDIRKVTLLSLLSSCNRIPEYGPRPFPVRLK